AALDVSLLGGLCGAVGCELCDAASNRCLTTCEEQSDCPDGSLCDGRACQLPRPSYTAIGEPCSASCAACVDAVDSQYELTTICTATCPRHASCPGDTA